MKARLLSDSGALSLDGRALLYWMRLPPKQRERLCAPEHAMRRLLTELEMAPRSLHPVMEPWRDELIAECKRITKKEGNENAGI